MADMLDKDFQSTILKMLREVKKDIKSRKCCMNKMDLSTKR